MTTSKRLSIIGTGYVGLVYAVCMAELGHDIVAIDVDAAKIARLAAGSSTIYEPGLEDLLRRNLDAGRLRFTTEYDVAGADFVFLAVSTPSTLEGAADLRHVRDAVQKIGENTHGAHPIIVNKSTAPVGTSDTLDYLLARQNGVGGHEFEIVANPEFLREGSAVRDFFHPDRIVLGSHDEAAARAVAALYAPLDAQVVFTDPKTAEMIKYASNAFLATKISFINEIASICEGVGADIGDVAHAMGLDPRIGSRFLNPGLGFGGSCLPKDVRALTYLGAVHGAHPQLLNAVLQINADQRRRAIRMLRDALGSLESRVITLLGVAFKPGTDDIREAPAVDLARLLMNEGAIVHAYDPFAMEPFSALFPQVEMFEDAYAAASQADALVIATEWPEFSALDLDRLHRLMQTPLVADCRNALDREQVLAAGFACFGVGTGIAGLGAIKQRPARRSRAAHASPATGVAAS
ncbi:MAG: UDP-glucose/GDP-mannose dehydrogenase family protein [Dehalococcoidia bacterium]|nr:UDP-glucose/GDP-mannose dehydrogenase family protein [Dehalococcoidia bacterium]